MSELRKIPIYRSLNRSSLILGCERELILLTGLFSVMMIFVMVNFISTIVGILFWFICVFFLRRMGDADPMMSKVYIKHIKYQRFYHAKTTPFAPNKEWKRNK